MKMFNVEQRKKPTIRNHIYNKKLDQTKKYIKAI